MEIRRWHCYLVINCAFIIPLLSAKSISLNEVIAAESKSHKSLTTPFVETNTRISLNKALPSETVHKSRKFKSTKYYSSPLTLGTFPSLKPRKLSDITSRLKSRSLSDLFRPIYKRKRQSKKREAYKNGKIDEKYFPLFKNLGLLFDNLLNESGESYEITKKKLKRRKDSSSEKRGIVCSCALKSDAEQGETRSLKKTIVFAKTSSVPTEPSITFEKSTTAATTTDSSLGNIGSLGQNKDLPILFPRDTSSSRGDDNGYSERSRPAFHGSAERDITRNYGNRKYPTRNREYKFSTEYDEEDSDGDTRNDAGRDESRRGRNRGNANISYERSTSFEETNIPKAKKAGRNSRGHVNELRRQDKLKIRRNETESEEFIPKHIRGIRGPLSENKISNNAEPIQSEENYEKGVFSLPLNNTGDKRLADGSGTPARENQEVRPRDEAIISINDMSNLDLVLQREPRIKAPSVSIIDGYSVARDKNGHNKLTEKSIRIHV